MYKRQGVLYSSFIPNGFKTIILFSKLRLSVGIQCALSHKFSCLLYTSLRPVPAEYPNQQTFENSAYVDDKAAVLSFASAVRILEYRCRVPAVQAPLLPKIPPAAPARILSLIHI